VPSTRNGNACNTIATNTVAHACSADLDPMTKSNIGLPTSASAATPPSSSGTTGGPATTRPPG
jgi:hypothetical protein